MRRFCKPTVLVTLGTLAIASQTASAFVLVDRHAPRLDMGLDGVPIQIQWDVSIPKGYTFQDVWRGGAYADATTEEITRMLMNEAAAAWSSVPGSRLKLEIIENAGASIDAWDKQNVISIVSDGSATSGGGALPIPIDGGKKGWLIEDCDITIDPTKVTPTEMLIALTHELGHCIGLGHPHTSSSSIMSYARPESAGASLSYDDQAAVLYLYPDPEVVDNVDPDTLKANRQDAVAKGKPADLLMCGVVGTRQGQSAFAWMSFLLSGLLPLAFGRRRERASIKQLR